MRAVALLLIGACSFLGGWWCAPQEIGGKVEDSIDRRVRDLSDRLVGWDMEGKLCKPMPPAETYRVAEIEAAIGYTLPNSYKHFLLLRNGGVPGADWEWKYIGMPDVRELFSTDSTHLGRLEDFVLSMNDVRPREMFPFAETNGGSWYAISLDGEKRGRVFLWLPDHNIMQDTATTADRLRAFEEIASSFEEFAGKFLQGYKH